MKRRIFWNVLLFALAAALLMCGVVIAVQYGIFEQRIVTELSTEAGYIAAGLPQDTEGRAASLEKLSRVNRITLIAPDGTVAYDNAADASAMENHAERPEVAAAMTDGIGVSSRYSETDLNKLIYCAYRLDDGWVLRIAATQKSALGIFDASATPIILILVALIAAAIPLSHLAAKRIVAPINRIDLNRPLDNDIYDELSPLMLRMQRQHDEISAQMEQLTHAQSEFAAVTEGMREGLVLIDREGNVLFINRSASEILNARADDSTGEYFLSLDRSEGWQSAVTQALGGEPAETLLPRGGRSYQLLVNPVTDGGRRNGVVVLLLDITDRQEAELSRREFTSNVTHELKTPLTSIKGYAEIIRDGIAKPEDTQRFAGRIFDEAARLVALVDDILRLSRLDEGAAETERESVKLAELCSNICASLSPLAQKRDIALNVTGEEQTVSGSRKLISEMIYNLADNAVKYNIDGGSVTLLVGSEDGRPTVTVTDTGIGIPREHQSHVFERFYRVDKSHSRETGGTGLGLSIVKHAALAVGAETSLTSEPGKGTSVKLKFS